MLATARLAIRATATAAAAAPCARAGLALAPRVVAVSTLRAWGSTCSTAATGAHSTADVFRATDQFEHRHIGPRKADQADMLRVLGFNDMNEFMTSVIPHGIRVRKPLTLAPALSESEALAALRAIAQQNKVHKSFIGMGYYGTHTPSVILRNIMENPAWYTSYTPYQAEISQGRLEMLLNYQTMVTDLTGLSHANASLLDEATAAAEAINMCLAASKNKNGRVLVSNLVHPQTIEVVKTRCAGLGVEVDVLDVNKADLTRKYSGILVQYPDTHGNVDCWTEFTARAHEAGSLVVAASDLLALTVLTPPGEWGADIAVGSAQRFGVPMGYGGPHAGFMATTEKLVRKMPGRLIGVSKDVHGNQALRMSLQTREQHIRRDHATSNICTAQALLANMAAAYAVYHGPAGVRAIADRVRNITGVVSQNLTAAGHTVLTRNHFDTLVVRLNGTTAESVLAAAVQNGQNLRLIDEETVGLSCDETTTRGDIETLLKAFGITNPNLSSAGAAPLPDGLRRSSAILTHPVFNTHRSETQMLRYLHRLQARDLSLTTSMISLGSCTMKLNATSEMIPVTWPEFGGLHPFVPLDQAAGYQAMIKDMHADLCRVTGFAAMSSQPNAGSQGEYAGLRCIADYHASKGAAHRNVCLIPESAHGTNPASAVMAGMKVVGVATDSNGSIDIEDLRAKAVEHRDHLSCMMVTYPSTFGVFEDNIRDLIQVIHDNGGLVYMDGANMNAQVGFCSPGDLGADVCHLNLHKTFCIPHGGGGPGVGSIGVTADLAPFLPGHVVVPTGGEGVNTFAKPGKAVSAAPFGSASILPITWMYVKMMGADGLRSSTQHAILNANYMAKRLENAYTIRFRGPRGQCAHEFIIDIRPFKEHGVTEEDVAKRLIDYGFHAPTMSWPVPGTLMIEPTESEDRGELDRFCDALLSIRKEIDDVVSGRVDKLNNPLKNAPHTSAIVTGEWNRPYPREQGAFPAPATREHKYWPRVSRIDNVYGDRNLVCTCPPVSAYTGSGSN